MDSRPTFYEFFAGGGMARIGLGPGWRCLFANDRDPVKTRTYAANFGEDHLSVTDVWALTAADLPGRADLAWASSPCQDLSVAGRRLGLSGARSSAFWGFWRLVQALEQEGRAPRLIVIENVAGLVTSHAGQDFETLCQALADAGYAFGALEIDAALFVPQSRPRLFIVAMAGAGSEPGARLSQPGPTPPFHSPRVIAAFERLPSTLKACWLWWPLPVPPRRNLDLAAVLEPDDAVAWNRPDQTARLLAHLSPRHRERLARAEVASERQVAALFRRMRHEAGETVQRAELRFDGLAGCLRTPGGGSSRQALVMVEGGRVRTRLVSPREGARLMGLPEDYVLPPRATAALQVVGDGVAVPVVRHLAHELLALLIAQPQMLAAE